MDDYEKILREELAKIKMQKQILWRRDNWETMPLYQELLLKEQEIRKKYKRLLLDRKLNEEKEKKL